MCKYLSAVFALALPLVAFGQTGYSITGGLSNFDCGNHCDDPCDEFEIDIEDCLPSDITHTYRNGNYGSPTITPSASGTGTIIDYRNPQHLTAVGSIEHFGVGVRNLTSLSNISVRWFRNGRPATVNGVVPISGGGSAPATQPIIPSISSDLTYTVNGDGVAIYVTNNDPVQAIWIKRSGQVTTGAVTLEALMPNDPIVTTSVDYDSAPLFLPAGSSVTLVSDLIEIEEQQSVVFAAHYYQNLSSVGPFGNQQVLGPELGNVMTATATSPAGSCQIYAPVVQVQPHDVTADAGRSVDLRVSADSSDYTISYQWLKEGQPLTNNSQYSGVTTDGLSIDSLDAAAEGIYSVRVFNDCGSIVSDSALVFITGHNLPPVRQSACPADLDNGTGLGIPDGGVDVNDLLFFLAVFEAGDPAADLDNGTGLGVKDGGVDVNDLLFFLSHFEAGC